MLTGERSDRDRGRLVVTENVEPDGWPEMKFANVHIDRILNGEKAVTFRIGLGSEFETGQPFWICDQDGDRVISKRVDRIESVPLKEAARMDIPGHKSYMSVERLIEAMDSYYTDETVTEYTQLDIVWWK